MAAVKSVKVVRLAIGFNRFSSKHNSLQCISKRFIAQTSDATGVTIEFRNGLPALTLPLPSTGEKCQFVVRSIAQTVEDICKQIKKEDNSINDVAFYNSDGVRVSASTSLDHVIRSNFKVRLNDKVFSITTPILDNKTVGNIENLIEIRQLVNNLHSVLNAEDEKVKEENFIADKVAEVHAQLQPLEQQKDRLAAQSERSTNRYLWLGLALMGVQAGVLGRLTWYEYSWDIMEPVTYFVTYSAVMGGFAYYCATRQQYEYHEAKDRLVLTKFHKFARKSKFDYTKYNELKNTLMELESQMKRIRESSIPVHKRFEFLRPISSPDSDSGSSKDNKDSSPVSKDTK